MEKGWKFKKEKTNLIVGTDAKPTQFKSGEVIINKKSTKKHLDKLIAINNDGVNNAPIGKVTNDATDGGLLKGKPHYDENGNPTGGIPGVVDGVKNIETEGEEFVVNAEASRKHWKELSKINQEDGNGVAIGPQDSNYEEDPEEEYSKGGKIEFNANHIPNKWILEYAKKIKKDHPEIWKLGGNIFGNEAFENLKRVSERGYWLDSEEWMYIKWRSYVARHQRDYHIGGVVAMLKWCDKVSKGWPYMKQLIEEKIAKKGWKHKQASKMKDGGQIKLLIDSKDKEIRNDENYFPFNILNENDEKLGRIDLMYRNDLDAYQISNSSVKEKGKGIGKKAYINLIKTLNKPIYSDSSLTNDAKYLWDSLVKNNYAYYDEDKGKYKTLKSKSIYESKKMSKGSLLAPNGNTSNLTPEQYKLVRTPAFKAWFGDWENDLENSSKVVDENGEPLVVYHGSKYTNKYYNFDLNAIDDNKVKAFFFSRGIEHAKRYTYDTGYIREFFINIRNLFDPKSLSKQDVKNILSILDKKLVIELNNYNEDDSFFDEIKKEYGIYDMPTNLALFHILTKTNSSWQIIEQPSFQNYLIKKGYEGFKTSEQSNLIKKGNENFAVYSPKNIKLADGTNTTFDGSNPDIRFDEGGDIQKAIYRIIKSNGRIKYAGTDDPSWLTLEMAKKLVSYSDGEMIYEFDKNGNPLWEILENGGTIITYKDKYNTKYKYKKGESHSLEQIHIDTGVSMKGLQQIYDKGIGAYKTNPQSVRPNVKSKEQWAMARVYSSVMGGKAAKIDAKELKMENGGIAKGKTVKVKVEYLEEQFYQLNKEMDVPISVFKQYQKTGKVPREFLNDLTSEIEDKNWVETNPMSVHLTMVEKMANGGNIKWSKAKIGDSARVVSENKMGVIVKDYGRKFHLKFVDGTQKTYDASELYFYNLDEDEYGKGGSLMVKGNLVKVGDIGIYDGRVKENITVTSISPKIVTFVTSNGVKKGVYTYKFEKFYIPSNVEKTIEEITTTKGKKLEDGLPEEWEDAFLNGITKGFKQIGETPVAEPRLIEYSDRLDATYYNQDDKGDDYEFTISIYKNKNGSLGSKVTTYSNKNLIEEVKVEPKIKVKEKVSTYEQLQNHPLVESIEREYNPGAFDGTDYTYWLYLKPGYKFDSLGTTQLQEGFKKDLIRAFNEENIVQESIIQQEVIEEPIIEQPKKGKMAYEMTLDEYQSKVSPIIKEYRKFIKKYEKWFAAASYYGLLYLSLEEVIDAFNNDIQYRNFSMPKKDSWTFRNFTPEQQARYEYSYRKTRNFDENYTQDPTPQYLIDEKNNYINKFKEFFTQEEINSEVDQDELKSNKRSVRRAIDNGTYARMLESGEITIERLNEIGDSVGVRIPKSVLSPKEKLKAEFEEKKKKALSQLPKISVQKMDELIQSILNDLKPLESEIFIKERKRILELFSKVTKLQEISVKDLAQMNLPQINVYIITEVRVIKEDRKTIDKFVKVDLTDNWEIELNKALVEFVEALKYKIIFSIINNFDRITVPIAEIERLGIKAGNKGFEGQYKFIFENGCSFIFETQSIPAGGYNIQAFHYRFLSNFIDVKSSTGEKIPNNQFYQYFNAENYSKLEKEFNQGGNVDKKDTVTLDIPLLIRTLELAREDIKSDEDLHRMVERLLNLKNKKELTMDDYDYIAKIQKLKK
jgi:hypothetical protein